MSRIWKKGTVRRLVVIFLFLLTVWPRPAAAAVQDDRVTVEMSYGFQGNVRNGSCVPLTVTLTNRGGAFSGQLRLQVPVMADGQELGDSLWMGDSLGQSGDDRIYTYEKEIEMQAGETQTILLYPELPAFEAYLYISVISGGNVLGSQSLKVDASANNGRLLVGVVTSQNIDLEELDGLQIKLSGQYPVESFIKALRLSKDEICPNPDALAHLDILIADGDTEFSREQRLALDVWQENGGFFLTRDREPVKEMVEELVYGEEQEVFAQRISEMGSYILGEAGILDSVPVKERPSMVKYIVLLLIYIFLVGPGLYIFLKRKHKRSYLWGAICGLSVFFVLLIGILGRATNVYAPFISYSGIYQQWGDIWSEDIKIGIQAPYNSQYQMYLDKEYRLAPWEIGTMGARLSDSGNGEQVQILLGEEKNKVNISHVPVFKQSYFQLKKDSRTEKLVTSSLSGTDTGLRGTLTNQTPYTIRQGILMMKNRAAVVGTLEAGKSMELEELPLTAFSDISISEFLKQYLDFSDYRFPQYEMDNYSRVMGELETNLENGQTVLLGIVENPDLSFQENSGYKIYGTMLAQIWLDVDWSEGSRTYCPNLETYGTSEDGMFFPDSNLLYNGEMIVDYPAGNIEILRMTAASLSNERYYIPFQGTMAFYDWEKGTYVEVEDWERTYLASELAPYLSDEGVLRVQYLPQDTGRSLQASSILPYISVVRKADG